MTNEQLIAVAGFDRMKEVEEEPHDESRRYLDLHLVSVSMQAIP
jgi:hypothetical protein